MRVYKYWANGQQETDDGYHFSIWRGSNDSPEDAQRLADQAVDQLAFRPHRTLPQRGPQSDYTYQSRHVPEELISSFSAQDGSLLAAVTRNRYGALVLNTADCVIIDADIPPAAPRAHLTGGGLLSWLWGGSAQHAEEQLASPADERLAQIKSIASYYSRLSFRIYRTRAGFRIFLLNQRLPPNDPLAMELLEAFEADQNYRNLCRVQQSYRARLTPKPFAMNLDYPPFHFPYNQHTRDSAKRWLERYELASENFRVCQKVCDMGPGVVDPEVDFLLNLHDESCRVQAELPLA